MTQIRIPWVFTLQYRFFKVKGIQNEYSVILSIQIVQYIGYRSFFIHFILILILTKQRTLISRKRKSPQSKSHKIKRPEKPVKSQPKDGQMNKKRQLTQNRKPSQSQRKPKRRSKLKNIRNSLSNNRELNKISTRLEEVK
ncbi:Hypothetical_protein [Hexamita inflata]|uniref:Hypothetical_protein n=1 Tax=Hexamita inflata TaxID=28002 RepID=A0AA86NY53_9EUKA|nr:Hypothetical protein HINF_LOCUS14514 [Hexamita inflata]